MTFRELKLRRDPECPVCGDEPTLHELIDYEQFCGIEPESATVVEEITAVGLKQELDRGDDVFILDVRNPPEYEICRIDGAHLIPLGDLLNRLNELDTSREIVAQCRSGARSAQAVQLLRQAGFRKVRNLEGGILAWARDVDPSVPAY